MRRFRQGDAPVILYSPRGVKLFDFGLNRIIETDDEDLINLLLAMGAIEIPPVVPPVPQDLTEVAARINALDGRVLIVEGRADIKSVGAGLSLSGAGELSATGSGGQGPPGEKGEDGYSPTVTVTGITGGHRVTITDVQGPHAFEVLDGQADSVDWANVTNKPVNLATKDDVAAKVFVAEYNVTTAQEIIAFAAAANEPNAPMLVKRGNDYYTVLTVAKQADNKIIIRTFGTLGGKFYMFTYTVTNGSWASSSYGFQQILESGTNIKTVGGQSLLGSGDIPISSGVTSWNDITDKPADLVRDSNYTHTEENFSAADKTKLDDLEPIYSLGAGLSLNAQGELSVSGSGQPVSWADITNKPANLVQDAAYVHTDSNFTAAEKAKLSGLENYDDTALSGRVTTLEGAGYQTAQNVDDKIADALEVFDHLDYKVADSPPTPTTVVIGGQTVQTQPGVRYMVKHSTDDRYAEYILIDGAIYDIGSTGDIDLSGYATTAAMNTALAGKQDTLVSGTNIKTVNGKSLLGAGDITLANANMQTEGDWRYKINPDNTFEAYYYKSGVTLTITDQSGNFFRSALQTLALPAGIANNYAATPLHASVNAAHNNYPCFGTLASMATNQVKYYAMSGSSRGQSPNYIVTAHVFGILAANA